MWCKSGRMSQRILPNHKLVLENSWTYDEIQRNLLNKKSKQYWSKSAIFNIFWSIFGCPRIFQMVAWWSRWIVQGPITVIPKKMRIWRINVRTIDAICAKRTIATKTRRVCWPYNCTNILYGSSTIRQSLYQGWTKSERSNSELGIRKPEVVSEKTPESGIPSSLAYCI